MKSKRQKEEKLNKSQDQNKFKKLKTKFKNENKERPKSKDASELVMEKYSQLVCNRKEKKMEDESEIELESKGDDDDTIIKRKATKKDLERKREKARQNRIVKKKIKRGEIVIPSKKPSEALAYLKQWQTAKSQWKFNKKLQIWLLQNMYRSDMISDEDFDILLEYVVSAQGKAKDETLTKAGERIKFYEELDESARDNEEQIKIYGRARRILQNL